jgi:hypothetical protein
MNLNQKEINEYIELLDFRCDFPNLMTDGDWERYAELRERRFEGE